MNSVGDTRPCSTLSCAGKQILTEIPRRARIRQIDEGKPFPQALRRLNVWICTIESREHVEVQGWGTQPVQPCTFQGCGGAMVHYFAARQVAPAESDQPVKKGHHPRLEALSGWLCVENPDEHFTPD